MMVKVSRTLAASLLITTSFLFAQTPGSAKPKPRVVVIGVNGMEMDVLRPLILQGKMPNLTSVIKRGAYGKLRTVSAPNCPRVYSTLFTSTTPEEHGVTGFIVGGVTANTNMLKEEPIWSILSKNHITVGMANVPATFPVMPVNGYMVSGMLTRGKNCEDGVLVCSQAIRGGRRECRISRIAQARVDQERRRLLRRLRADALG